MGNPKGVKRDFSGLEERRLRAAECFSRGASLAEVAERTGVSLASANRWRLSWTRGGVDALKKAGRAGRKPRLTPVQMEQIRSALATGCRPELIGGLRWTDERADLLIWRLTGVKYHTEHVARILRRLGWRWYRRPKRERPRVELGVAAAIAAGPIAVEPERVAA
jgi:transposase